MNIDSRAAPRKRVGWPIEVIDIIRGDVIGHVGNLSHGGMLLICARPLRDNALYQLRFRLKGADGTFTAVDTGVHTMWSSPAATGNQHWSGLRIISISPAHATVLGHWLAQH